jgi:hypothetical protein
MPTITNRPAADPFDDIDRLSSGADSSMARQDRADLPGQRSDEPGNRGSAGDVYTDAARELSQQELDPEQARIDGDREAERIADGDPDVVPLDPPRGADDDDPIDETERAGDDSIR